MQIKLAILLITFVGTCAIWIATAIMNARLISIFRKKYPDESKRELPASGIRSLNLFSYFMSKKFAVFLNGNSELRSFHKKFIAFVFLSIVWPVVTFLITLALLFLNFYP
jgi:hypothetical protein